MIRALAQTSDVYQRLIDSFAPHIQGQTLIKEAILLLIVGSNQRSLGDGSKIRGDINVFLVGDPGTAKSEMLKFCARIAPRGLYTSGRGSTAAGLTAAVVKDKTGIMMLEAGAVVLGDQGLVCIDEFDKMKPEDRSALHEVMEQQSASIAKGGIVATLNARTSILAAANPMYGKYDPFKNITENGGAGGLGELAVDEKGEPMTSVSLIRRKNSTPSQAVFETRPGFKPRIRIDVKSDDQSPVLHVSVDLDKA